VLVRVNDQEVFYPRSDAADLKDLVSFTELNPRRSAIIFLDRSQSSFDLTGYVQGNCSASKCENVEFQSKTIEGQKVNSASFDILIPIANNPNHFTFAQRIVFDGLDVKLDYTGDKTAYQVHKSTIDSLMEKIAKSRQNFVRVN
jgi:hypothetical protein